MSSWKPYTTSGTVVAIPGPAGRSVRGYRVSGSAGGPIQVSPEAWDVISRPDPQSLWDVWAAFIGKRAATLMAWHTDGKILMCGADIVAAHMTMSRQVWVKYPSPKKVHVGYTMTDLHSLHNELSRYYPVKISRNFATLCGHCGNWRDNHAADKCLFDASSFSPFNPTID